MLILALLVSTADDPPKERVFGDWAVNCDNTRRCEAVALMPSERLGEVPTQALIRRDAGPAGEVEIEITPEEGIIGLAAYVDEARIAGATAELGALRFTGPEARRLATAMARGTELTLRTADGTISGRVSLAGTSAALRHIDARQGRAGGKTALVARGPANAVPPAPAVPKVPGLRPARREAPALTPAQLAAIKRRADCGFESGEGQEEERHRLDRASTLVLYPCGSGAYNMSHAALVVTNGRVTTARFDTPPDWMEPGRRAALVTNAGWDAAKGVLSHFDKARGLGDCGTTQSWVWDGSRFRLIAARRLEECRGSIEWPTVFRASPVPR